MPSRSILPPIRLRELLAATDAVHGDRASSRDLAFLLGAGSPLCGARPKCLVSLPDCTLALAKFSKPDDVGDIAIGEILALAVAREAGIHTADHRLVVVDGRAAIGRWRSIAVRAGIADAALKAYADAFDAP